MLFTGLPLSVSSILDVLTPITSPSLLTSGPPLLPGFIAASVCNRSTPSTVLVEGDDTAGYGQATANPVCKRKAERKHLVAHAYAIRMSNRDRVKTVVTVYLHQREVGSCVSLQHITVIEASVVQPDTHAARATYNMLIGYDQPRPHR